MLLLWQASLAAIALLCAGDVSYFAGASELVRLMATLDCGRWQWLNQPPTHVAVVFGGGALLLWPWGDAWETNTLSAVLGVLGISGPVFWTYTVIAAMACSEAAEAGIMLVELALRDGDAAPHLLA